MNKKTLFAGIAILIISVSGCSTYTSTSQEVQSKIDGHIKGILLTHPILGGPTQMETLSSSYIPIEIIKKTLLRFVEELCNTKEYSDTLICQRSINLIGEFKYKKAIPLLQEIADKTDNENTRAATMRAIVEIGDEGLLNYAEKVFREREKYKDMDRYSLYEELEPYLKENFSKNVDSDKLKKFLEKAHNEESYMGNVGKLSEILYNKKLIGVIKCTSDSNCQKIDCSGYENTIKNGLKPYCTDNNQCYCKKL